MNSTLATDAGHFGWVDHTMFSLMLAISTVVGVLIGVCGKQDTEVDYLLGGKEMSVFPIAMSLIFSQVSGITMLALPTEFYTYGAVYYCQYVSGFITCVLNYYIFLPLFFELQLTSTNEYLELRFDRKVRTMSSLLFALGVLFYLPIVIYVPALAFNQVSGINVHIITTTVCGICIAVYYACLKAVVWTDFLQSFVTVGSFIAIIILGLIRVGGFSAMIDRSKEGGRLDFFVMDPDPFARNTFWTIVVGSTFCWMSGLSVNQGMIQKFIALPTLTKARKSHIIFYIGYLLVKSLSFITGLLIYSSYYNCDPITSKQISKADQILPFFTMETAAHIPGLPGLFIAGIFSASLSTLSSNFNCLSATIFEDLVYPWIKGIKFFEDRIPLVLKSIVVIAGSVCILLVFAIEKSAGIILTVATSASGITSGALLSMFLLGMLFPWANQKGCLAGSAVSLVVMSWIMIGAQTHKASGIERFPYLPMSIEGCEDMFNVTVPATPAPTALPEGMGNDAFALYKISFYYYCLVGTFISMVVGLAVSYFTGFQDPKSVDARLLVSFMKNYGHSRETDARDPSEKEMLNMKTNDITNGKTNIQPA